jgi:RNA polymerase sigma-70 factor (ECF subfamily)
VTDIDSNLIADTARRYGASLVLFARQWCTFPDDAVQEALIDFANLPTAPNDCAAWLFKATKRRALNQTRGEQRRRQRQRVAAQSRDRWFIADEQTSNSESTNDLELLERGIATLDPTEREIVIAKIWGDLTFQQIAELVDAPSSTVHRHYHRALQTLHQFMRGTVVDSNRASAPTDKISR